MKKFILLELVFWLLILTSVVGTPFNAVAKEAQDIKLDCPTISSVLHFENDEDPMNTGDYIECYSQEDDIPVSNVFVRLGGDIAIAIPEDLADPNMSGITNDPPDKTENLLIGDEGEIFYWGSPWGDATSYPTIEYRAKLGLCDMDLSGYAIGDSAMVFQSGYKPDWPAAADYMKQKLAQAAKEIEGAIAEECGAKNVVDAPKAPGRSSDNPVRSLIDSTPGSEDPLNRSFEQFVNDLESIPSSMPLHINIERIERQPDLKYDSDTQQRLFSFGKEGKDILVDFDSGDGDLTLQLPDGSAKQQKMFEKITVPVGTRLTTEKGYNFINLAGNGPTMSLFMGPRTEIEIIEDKPGFYHKVKVWKGTVRFKAEEAFQVVPAGADIDIIVGGTDLGIAYDKNKGQVIVEIYDGSVDVASKKEKKTISSTYGQKIKRIEIKNNGPMVEKTAIPKNQRGAKLPVWVYLGGAIILVTGIAFFLKRKRRDGKIFKNLRKNKNE